LIASAFRSTKAMPSCPTGHTSNARDQLTTPAYGALLPFFLLIHSQEFFFFKFIPINISFRKCFLLCAFSYVHLLLFIIAIRHTY
jgi:hypothetical protein